MALGGVEMAAIVLLLALSQLPPGPLDAFRANYASIKAEMDFELTGGTFKDDAKRLWEGHVPEFVEKHIEDWDDTIVGHWACDGVAEYFRFSSPQEILDRAAKAPLRMEAGKVSCRVVFIPKVEALWDGELLIGHQEHPHYKNIRGNPGWSIVNVDVINDELAGYLGTGAGPFNWRGWIFPHMLRFYKAQPGRRRVMRWGNPTEVEVYREGEAEGKGWRRIEVSYDPAIGYLPRLVRSIGYNPERDAAGCSEIYLTEARPCAAGGFVPVEWYNLLFEVPNFKSRFPDYDESTDLAPATLVAMVRFRGMGFRDLKRPVALTEVKDVHTISGTGGAAARPAKISSISIDDVKTLLGERVKTPAHRMMVNVDQAELRDLGRRPAATWRPYLVGLAALVMVALALLRWRRARAALTAVALLAALAGASGCGAVGDPVTKLTAGYEETFVHIDPQTHELPMSLVVRNDGNRTLRLLKADGGCSCRKVDQSSLPVAVKPGKMIVVPVRLSIVPSTKPQSSQFQFETDRGVVAVTAPFFTLVSHELNPDSVANHYMYESDGWSFVLTHRFIYRADGAKPDFALKFPKEFSVVPTSRREGRVGGAPEYAFGESSYRMTLNDHALGSRKASVRVISPSGAALLDASVVWKRVAFLSTVPDRVILGTRPVRVFLRCPDEGVELTKVLSAPGGIEAVVTSAREITVMPGEHAPAVVDGTIEVGTTAEGRPPLRVPVIRYRPSDDKPLVSRADSGTRRRGFR